MCKVEFKFDKEKDIWNYWDSANKKSQFFDFSQFISPELLHSVKGKTQEESYEIIKEKLLKIHESSLMPIFLDSVSKAWSSIEKEYFKRLKILTKKPICSKKFIAYLTTTTRCPYNKEENWFMVNFFSSIPNALRTIAHEIMHFQFYKYGFDEVEKILGKNKAEDLKEALTILLNLEFLDLWYAKDNGYPVHKDLRNFIEIQWKKEKDYDCLLNNCIEFLKNNGN